MNDIRTDLYLFHQGTNFAAYRFLMNVDIIVGNTLPDMVFTIILCVIVTKIADKITSKSKKA